ncbi:MAG: hypothetical protein AB7T37_17000 [Dehalococcoidia bacterium]
MPDLLAEPLSPIDAATLWPQLRRLSTEIVATRGAENLLVSSGLAATGLTNLPPIPRTVVLGIRRGLTYRGVLVGRELDGGAAWEAVSLRIARDKDDDAVTALLEGAAPEVARRSGRALIMRCPEGSPHATAVRRAGLSAGRIERLFAVPRRHGSAGGQAFRSAGRADKNGIFRLYCRSVPEHIRRKEAPTLQDWRALLDSFDIEREFVLDGEGGLAAWVGFADRECRILVDSAAPASSLDSSLDLVETHVHRHGTLVLGEDQVDLERRAGDRGYSPLGVRLVYARRLALLNPLKEGVPVAERAVPQTT